VYDRETGKEVLHYWSYAGDYVHNVMCEWGIALVAAVYLRRELGVRHVQFYTDLDMIPRSMAGAAAKFGVPVVTASGTPAPHITHISDPRLRAMSDDLIAIAREYDSFTVAHVRGHAGVKGNERADVLANYGSGRKVPAALVHRLPSAARHLQRDRHGDALAILLRKYAAIVDIDWASNGQFETVRRHGNGLPSILAVVDTSVQPVARDGAAPAVALPPTQAPTLAADLAHGVGGHHSACSDGGGGPGSTCTADAGSIHGVRRTTDWPFVASLVQRHSDPHDDFSIANCVTKVMEHLPYGGRDDFSECAAVCHTQALTVGPGAAPELGTALFHLLPRLLCTPLVSYGRDTFAGRCASFLAGNWRQLFDDTDVYAVRRPRRQRESAQAWRQGQGERPRLHRCVA
jgi:ribonuclease HI